MECPTCGGTGESYPDWTCDDCGFDEGFPQGEVSQKTYDEIVRRAEELKVRLEKS